MNFTVKSFGELTRDELYEILKVRSQIFITELKMNCQDIDGVDYDAFHFYLEQDGKIIAYLRAFYIDDNTVKIGRVLTLHHGKGYGIDIIKRSIDYIKNNMPCKKISLNSQKQVVDFYNKVGFKTVSDEFLEEGILHIKMELDLDCKN